MATYALTVSTNALGLGVISSATVVVERKRTIVTDIYPTSSLYTKKAATNISGIATIQLEADDGSVFHEVKIFDVSGILVYKNTIQMPPQDADIDDLPLNDIITESATQAVAASVTATTQANTATAQAGIATTQAGIATEQAVLTAADRVQTGLDVIAAEAAADAAAAAASIVLDTKKFNTYAEQVAYVGAYVDGQKADVLGYYAIGDGGFIQMYWSASSTADHNGGTVRKPTAVSGAGRWLALNKYSFSVEQFGAYGDGVADDTNALNKLLEYCVENGLQANMTKPSYKIRGAALSSTSRTGARTLNINFNVPTTITMDSGASGLLYFIYLNTTAENNVFFTGSALTFNGSSNCASFMRCDHNGADNTGVVDIQSNVIIKNLKNTDAASTIDNSGMSFIGPYRRVVIREPEIDTVERTNVANGSCSGITVSQFTGTVDIYSPKVSRVLTTSAIDADGIKVFGKPVDGVLANKRQGIATIHFGVFTDNQGRQVKSQCSETTIIKPISIRKNVVSILNGIDFDFQCGNGLLLEPEFIYKKNAGTSPLGASFRPVAFQQIIEDEEMSAHCIDGKMITEVAMLGFCIVTHSAGAKESVTKVKGLSVIPSGGLATTAFTTSIIETRADTIEAKSARTTIELSDCNGPLGCYGISYTNYGGTKLTSKLNIVVKDNFNTLLVTSFMPFYKASGAVCRAVETFLFRNNTGFKSLYVDLDFSVNKLPVGCCVAVDLASCTITGAPSWAASGYATFQCVDQYFAATGRSVWAIKGSATATSTMYWTIDGGNTWGQVK